MVMRPQRRLRESYGRRPGIYKQFVQNPFWYLQILCDRQLRVPTIRTAEEGEMEVREQGKADDMVDLWLCLERQVKLDKQEDGLQKFDR